MEKIRLNNFILWCKGWYQPIETDINFIAQAQKALVLDGYMPCNNPISISLGFIDELVEKNIISPIKLNIWDQEINKYMNLYKLDYHNAILFKIKMFFAFEIEQDAISLNPPIYNKTIYKLGFIGPKNLGNSYKMLTYKANKYFNKKIIYGKQNKHSRTPKRLPKRH